MIEPELFDFRPPVYRHRYVKKRWEKLSADADEYGPTHSITVVLPDTIVVPVHVEKAFAEDGHYYLIENVTLGSLADPAFVTSFAKNGKICATSLNTRVGVEDCISITNNILQMSLIESSYQQLCLPAKDSKISLDLKELKLNSKFYLRVKECFQRFQTKFDLLINWVPNDADVCPSSIASYFNKNGFDCQECFSRSTTKKMYNMIIPTGEDLTVLDTWLSYFCMDINIDDRVPSLLPCGKLTKLNSRSIGQVTRIVWTGFFNNNQVKLLLEKLRDFMVKESKSCWLTIHLEPFSNSPYPIAHKTLLFNPDGTYYVSYCTKCKKI